jgi:hypothetical protein
LLVFVGLIACLLLYVYVFCLLYILFFFFPNFGFLLTLIEKAIQISGVFFFGLGLVVVAFGVVMVYYTRLKQKNRTQIKMQGNQLSVQEGQPSLVIHEDIEVSISSESS